MRNVLKGRVELGVAHGSPAQVVGRVRDADGRVRRAHQPEEPGEELVPVGDGVGAEQDGQQRIVWV
eukprot:1891576-Prymnesium_polylepis.1